MVGWTVPTLAVCIDDPTVHVCVVVSVCSTCSRREYVDLCFGGG